MAEHADLFLVLPYLYTSSHVNICGITFRSNTDLSGLPPSVQEHFQTICGMFFVQDAVRIEKMVCAYVRLPPPGKQREDLERRILEAHLLIGLLYSRPYLEADAVIPFKNSALFKFSRGPFGGQSDSVFASLVWHEEDESGRIKRLDERQLPGDTVAGYTCVRNHGSSFWVAQGSRIFPELSHMILYPGQDLAVNLAANWERRDRWWWWRLYSLGLEETKHSAAGDSDATSLRERVFTALQWYLRSCRAAISEPEALVHLAIALETLLNVRGGDDKDKKGATERFKVAALALLGPVPRLEDWLEAFYDARSAAVHQGRLSALMFTTVVPMASGAERGRKSEGKDVPTVSLIE